MTQSLKRAELEPDVINYSSHNDPVLYYGNVVVRLGSVENLTLKVEHLSKILPSLEDMAGVLHMESWTEESKNIIFEKSLAVEDPSAEMVEEAESEPETQAGE